MLTRWRSLLVGLLLVVNPAFAEQHASSAASGTPAILVVGDSLSAEYGIRRGSGWVALLEQRLKENGKAHWHIANASISGDTTSGGLSRLPDALARTKPKVVILELGSNDALRGFNLDSSRNNLREMIHLSRQAGAQVLLVGMMLPPNYGRKYTQQFHQLYEDLAHEEKVALVPFLLDGIATDPSMFQDDRLHPNEKAQPILLDNVWAALRPLLSAQ